jgi:hypothetical protein
MLECLRHKTTDRKLRLFAVACCRRIWHVLTDAKSRWAVEVAERFSDGLATEAELGKACRNAAEAPQDPGYATAPPYSTISAIEHARIAASSASAHPANDATTMAIQVAGHAAIAASNLAWDENRGNWLGEMNSRLSGERLAQVRLLADILGPLAFRPVAIDPSVLAWNDRLVMRIAEAIYEKRQWGDMPILGDALMDAGCDSDEVVAHCRSGKEHVRGCWALDCLLDKNG